MALSPLHQLTHSLCISRGSSAEGTKFILVSTVVDSTWNIELGCQDTKDRWWRGAHPLPDAATQTELADRLPTGITRIRGWCEATEDTCMLKVVFELSPVKRFRVPLKEYDPQIAATRAMSLLFKFALEPPSRKVCALPSRALKSASVADLQDREQEHMIQELKRKITSLEKTLECKSHSVAPTAAVVPRKAPTIPKGASLANPSKRRRVVKDMRFDGE